MRKFTEFIAATPSTMSSNKENNFGDDTTRAR